jgi:hypothetical protein
MGKLKDSDDEKETLSFFQKLQLLPRKTILASFTFLLVGTLVIRLNFKKTKFKFMVSML